MDNRLLINENLELKRTIEAMQKKMHSEYDKLNRIEQMVHANKPDLAYSLSKILNIKIGPEKDSEDFSSIDISNKGKMKKEGASTQVIE